MQKLISLLHILILTFGFNSVFGQTVETELTEQDKNWVSESCPGILGHIFGPIVSKDNLTPSKNHLIFQNSA